MLPTDHICHDSCCEHTLWMPVWQSTCLQECLVVMSMKGLTDHFFSREAHWQSSLSHDCASLHNLTDTIPIEAIVHSDAPHLPQRSGSVPPEADEEREACTAPSLPLPGDQSGEAHAVE